MAIGLGYKKIKIRGRDEGHIRASNELRSGFAQLLSMHNWRTLLLGGFFFVGCCTQDVFDRPLLSLFLSDFPFACLIDAKALCYV